MQDGKTLRYVACLATTRIAPGICKSAISSVADKCGAESGICRQRSEVHNRTEGPPRLLMGCICGVHDRPVLYLICPSGKAYAVMEAEAIGEMRWRRKRGYSCAHACYSFARTTRHTVSRRLQSPSQRMLRVARRPNNRVTR